MDGKKPMTGCLLHLGVNLWSEECEQKGYYDGAPVINLKNNFGYKGHSSLFYRKDELRCDDSMWDDAVAACAKAGMSFILIDVLDGMEYDSHPEISVKGAWSKAKLKSKLDEIRKLGMTPYPKLNFSCCHDVWLKKYARMIGLPEYYEVVSDLIDEVCEVFDDPALFHIGLDEEIYQYQKDYNIVIVRNGDLWWHDLYFYIKCVEKHGARPWIWTHFEEERFEEYANRMPKSVILSDWFYFDYFDQNANSWRLGEKDRFTKGEKFFAERGFDLIPTSSNYNFDRSFETVYKAMPSIVGEEHLLGVMQSNWKATTEEFRSNIIESIENAKI